MPSYHFEQSIPLASINTGIALPGDSLPDTGLDLTKIWLSASAPVTVEIGYLIPDSGGDVFVPVYMNHGLQDEGETEWSSQFGGISVAVNQEPDGRRLAIRATEFTADPVVITGDLEIYQRSRTASIVVADTQKPTIQSAVLAEDGTTLTVTLDEVVTTNGAGFSGTASVTGALTYTYSSGSGTSVLVFTASAVVDQGETVDLDYNSLTGNVRDLAGNFMDSVSDVNVTNNSNQGGTPPPSGQPLITTAQEQVLVELWNGGVTPHEWATAVINRADTPQNQVSDDVGQWNFIAWKMTGNDNYAREAVLRAWATFINPNAVGHVADPDYFREYGWWFACCYPWLKNFMDGAGGRPTAQQWYERLNVWGEEILGNGLYQSYRVDIGDSDECVTFYAFLRLVDRWTAGDNPSAGTFATRDESGVGASFPCPTPAVVKAHIDTYWARADGGEWIESTEYNLGTTQLIHFSIQADDPTHYPGYATWAAQAANLHRWQTTPDFLEAVAWGDCQLRNQIRFYERISLCAIYAQLFLTGPDRTAMLNYFGQMAQVYGPISSHVLHIYRALMFFDPREIPASPGEGRPTGLIKSPGVGLWIYRPADHSGMAYGIAWNRTNVDHMLYGWWMFRVYRNAGWEVDQVIAYQLAFPPTLGYPDAKLVGLEWLESGGFVDATEAAGVITVKYSSFGGHWNVPFTWPSGRSVGEIGRVMEFTWPDTANYWDYVSINNPNDDAWWPAGVSATVQGQVDDAVAVGEVYKSVFFASVDTGGAAPGAITGGYSWISKTGTQVRWFCPDLDASKNVTSHTDPTAPPENFTDRDFYRIECKTTNEGTYVVPHQIYIGSGTPPAIPPAPPNPAELRVTAMTIQSDGVTLIVTLNDDALSNGGTFTGFAFNATGGALTATYASGGGTNQLTYTLSRTVSESAIETVTASYTGTDIEKSSNGDLLDEFTGFSVTNNSSQVSDPPGSLFFDHFNRVDGAVGNGWTVVGGNPVTVSNKLGFDGGVGTVITRDVPGSADSDVSAVLTSATGTLFGQTGLLGRVSGSSAWLLFVDHANNLLKIYDLPGFAEMASAAITPAEGDTFMLRMNGADVSGYRNGVLVIGPITDSSKTAQTGAGVWSGSSGQNIRYDNFRVGT